MSILGKDCPRCGETNAAYAVSCRCGFAFNSVDHVEQEESEDSLTLQEEELYLEYLKARAQQAAENAAATESRQAQAAAERAKVELEQQRARMKVMHDSNSESQDCIPSAPPARPQSIAPSPNPATAQAKPVTTPAVGERKQPASAAPTPAATPPVIKRKEPAPTTVKPSAPALKGGETTRPTTAKPPQDLNKHIPGPNRSQATSMAESVSQLSGHPAHSQTKIPMAGAGASRETKVQASMPATAKKVVPASAKTSIPAAPPKPEHVPSGKQPPVTSTSTTARPAPSRHGSAGAGAQTLRAAEASNKPATQADAVATKASAAAARAKQLAEALKAAQAERAATVKTSAPTPAPDSKTGQEKPAASSASSTAKTLTPTQTPRAAGATLRAGATIAKPAKGQQQKLNGHDKRHADINAIHIPGTGPGGELTPESDESVPKQAASAPATVAEQPDAGISSSSDRPTQKSDATARPMAGSEEAEPAKLAPGVTVTVAPSPDPQEELEAALKALSVRTPAPPAPGPGKAPADSKDVAASSEIGDKPAPTAEPTRAPDGLPPLEPVTPSNQKDCPNCTALLPMDAKRCRCGFQFPEVEETMPGLSLSDSDFAALDGDTSSTGITHLS